MMFDRMRLYDARRFHDTERLVRQDIGAKHDAERMRKNEVILGLIYEEGRAGKVYTMTSFAEAFENKAGLGGQTVIRDRLGVLTAKGYDRLVTHVFVKGDEYIDSDAVFGVRDSLISKFKMHKAGKAPDGTVVRTPYCTLHYDFVMRPAKKAGKKDGAKKK